jgi:hypothetical protein
MFLSSAPAETEASKMATVKSAPAQILRWKRLFETLGPVGVLK